MISKGKYRHFKGNYYQVIDNAKHSETQEDMVVYRALYGEGGLWVRPSSMWNEQVIDPKTGLKCVRFEPVGDADNDGVESGNSDSSDTINLVDNMAKTLSNEGGKR